MNAIAIIPARMASTRFPGKPMASIHKVPMIGHVYFRTRMSEMLSETYVATCDQEIYDYITGLGGKAVMTGDHHERCSDRTAEALLKIEQETGKTVDVVVMVQGDEPMIHPEMIDQSIRPFMEDESINILNLMAPLGSEKEHQDLNEVKVVCDLNSNAIYFSREPIPSKKKGGQNIPMMKQVCIIPFRRDYLLKYNTMEPTPLEIIESVDMLRIIENGETVKMVLTEYETLSVDTQEDLENVAEKMKGDRLMEQYKEQGAV